MLNKKIFGETFQPFKDKADCEVGRLLRLKKVDTKTSKLRTQSIGGLTKSMCWSYLYFIWDKNVPLRKSLGFGLSVFSIKKIEKQLIDFLYANVSLDLLQEHFDNNKLKSLKLPLLVQFVNYTIDRIGPISNANTASSYKSANANTASSYKSANANTASSYKSANAQTNVIETRNTNAQTNVIETRNANAQTNVIETRNANALTNVIETRNANAQTNVTSTKTHNALEREIKLLNDNLKDLKKGKEIDEEKLKQLEEKLETTNLELDERLREQKRVLNSEEKALEEKILEPEIRQLSSNSEIVVSNVNDNVSLTLNKIKVKPIKRSSVS